MASKFLIKSIRRAALAAITLLPAAVSVQAQAIPINFKQVGAGHPLADGTLHFDYSWQSSTGNLADLAACRVFEVVNYPGDADPYVLPNPPWNQAWANPTIRGGPAADGRGRDNQHPGRFAPPPYRNALFVADQIYRYQCGRGRAAVKGKLMGPIEIQRVVTPRADGDPCFVYTISKSGATASINPLPQRGCVPLPREVTDLAPSLSSETQTDGVVVSFSPLESGFRLHEPIYIQLSIQNNLPEAIRFDLGLNRKANLEFAITEPEDFKTVTSRLSDEGFGSVGRIVLGPHQTYIARFLLNEWHDFAEPGTYQVTAKLSGPVTTESGTPVKTTVPANFSVEVKARDVEHLALLSQQLADLAVDAPDMADAMDAALALSYIDDPVAVPSLRRLLVGETIVEDFAANGLARIANGESIDVLIAASISGNDEVKSLARSALKRAEGRVKDPELKNRIGNALKAQQ